jgi:hypothetical protein
MANEERALEAERCEPGDAASAVRRLLLRSYLSSGGGRFAGRRYVDPVTA